MHHYHSLNRLPAVCALFGLLLISNSTAQEEDVVLDPFLVQQAQAVRNSTGPLLEGKLAIVTGGASGIGRSVCLVLDREGATVVVADINETGSQETIKLMRQGRNHTAILTDVTNATQVANLFKQVYETFCVTVDIVVNSAGIIHNASSVANVSEEVFDKVVGVNLKGTFLITREAVRTMLTINATGRAILNVASVSGKGGYPYLSAYSASKGGVISFTKSVALEVATKGIRVNSVLPGYTNTPMTEKSDPKRKAYIINTIPMKRMAEPIEIAEVIVFMCGPRSSYMTGSAVLISGGSYL